MGLSPSNLITAGEKVEILRWKCS